MQIIGLHRLFLPVLLLAACESPPEIARHASAVSGGNPHDGHPAVGRLRIGSLSSCGATLIGQRTAVTAAHCADGTAAISFELDDGTSFPVEKTTLHPEFVKSDPGGWFAGSPFDLAVLRLKQAPAIKGLEVSTVAPVRGLPVTIIGYGAAQCSAVDAGSAGDPRVSCSGTGVKRIARNSLAELFEHELSIEGAANACMGDSGGAVLATIAGKELLVGLPVRGQLPCGVHSFATRIDAFFSWIDQAAEKDLLADRTLLGDGASRLFSDASAGDSTIHRAQSSGSRPGGCAVVPGQGSACMLLFLLVAAVLLSRSSRRDRR